MSKKWLYSIGISIALVLGIYFSSAYAKSVSLGKPQTAIGKTQKTQGEFAMQLCKALGLKASEGNYITALNARGITPKEGWKADSRITNREMANLLAKALGIETSGGKIAKKAEEAYRNKAIIVGMQGQINVKIGEAKNWKQAKISMELSQADSVKTGNNSWVKLRVGTMGIVKIKENTEIKLSKLSSNPNGSENIILYMNIGEILVDARGIPENSDFQVNTPTTVAAVRGTIYSVKVTGETTEIK